MTKRLWFVQQQPFDFMPLKAGLGMISDAELIEYEKHLYPHIIGTFTRKLCPKIYTTRTRPMAGEYQVVRGSRFKAVPLDPPIEFQVKSFVPFDLRKLTVTFIDTFILPSEFRGRYTIPELDLGIVGTTPETLRDELLKLGKNTTLDTPMFINRLEPISNG